jgi:RHS repeat-associated protein
MAAASFSPASEPKIESAQRGLREFVLRTAETENRLREDSRTSTDGLDGWSRRSVEFLEAQVNVVRLESGFATLPSEPGESRIWAPDERNAPEIAESAKEFLEGPDGSISPSNGELLLSFADFELPTRAGLGFAFRRTYSSFDRTDRGLGPGWECNWTPRLVFASGSDGMASRCDVRLGGRSFSFVRNGDAWTPPIDVFLELEVGDDAVSVLSPKRVRWAFEKSAETPNGWRLRSIATRHDKWTANRLDVSYLPDCDRIRDVTDPFGSRIRFAYDGNGRIVQIASPFSAVFYRYDDESGTLAEAETSPIAVSVGRTKTLKQTFRYEKSESGWRLCGETSSARPDVTTEFVYDDTGRVSVVSEKAGDASRAWIFDYRDGATTVKAPVPIPDTVYHYGKAPHPSLPDVIEIPTRNAKTSYEWTESLLSSRETDPVGVSVVREYDERNANPLLRGNLVVEKTIPCPARPSDWTETGEETDYLAGTALPETVRVYQIGKDGKKTFLKTERWKYSPDGDPVFHDDGGIVHETVYNRFGLPALEKDGNENVSVHYYGTSFPDVVDHGFQEGSPSNGGPEVRLVEDADWKTMFDAGNAIGLKRVFRANHENRLPAAMRETRTAWSPCGGELRNKCDRTERLFVRNFQGTVLADCDVGKKLVVTECHPGGEPERSFRLFDPETGVRAFPGTEVSPFSGRFFREDFDYDPFMALSGMSQTDERDARFVYERFPAGKMSAIVNPAGIRREDRYDVKTGWMTEQSIVGKSETAVLYKVLGRYPNGEVQSWEDSFGGVWTNLLDGFGEVATTVHPTGAVESHRRDGVGRELSVQTEWNGRLLSGSEYEYDPSNGLLLRKREYVDEASDGPRFVVTEECRYDGNGNTVARRGAKSDSWQISLFDGLDREVASLSPSGDSNCTVFREGVPAYEGKRFRGEKNGTFVEAGTISSYDAFGRLAEATPVGTDGKIASARRTEYAFDSAGRCVSERRQELTEVRTSFDTLGNAVKTETIPLQATHGEKPMVTRTEYLPDGRILKTIVENDALGLFGNKNDASAELVRADQTTVNEYDDLGRLVSTTNPDGLKATRVYNTRSLPERMVWTHIDTPGNTLRDLRFRFSKTGLVESIVDGTSGREIAGYRYDPLDRCVSAVDKTIEPAIVIRKEFDGLGDVVSERTVFGNEALPSLSYSRDRVAGTEKRTWAGLGDAGFPFWTEERLSFDPSGRLSDIGLDDRESIAVWTHIGSLPETRTVCSAESEWTYTAMLETESVLFSGAADGRIRYAYGPQGQTWFTSIEFPDDAGVRNGCSFSSYDDADAFRRHIAQNSEQKLPDDPLSRRKALLGDASDSLAAKKAERFLYDQAGNTTVRYGGSEAAFGKLSRVENDPQYVSPASVLPGDGSSVGDIALRELASNREATHASYDGSGNLAAESRTYDSLGNVVAFQGTYWDGERRYPVDWTNRWDALGRLESMEATAREDAFRSKKGDVLAELRFRYDAANRRIEKTVIDRVEGNKPRTETERTLYVGNDQTLVFRVEGGRNVLVGEYLWGEMERELLLAALPKDRFSETDARFVFQQDVGMNVVRVLEESGRCVSTASYLGFGENATAVPVRGIKTAMLSDGESRSFDGELDGEGACWKGNANPQFLALDLESSECLSELTIWTATAFPKDFLVYVVPHGTPLPSRSQDVLPWVLKKERADCCASVVRNGVFVDAGGRRMTKLDSVATPYRLSLGGIKGDRIVVVWNVSGIQKEMFDDPVRVYEFEVLKTPSNPAPIAFAGQWLDRETGLYYQINRYREAGSEKFLSPDPLGFLAGPNLYAYANNNPLEWHDPDGRFLHILLGAGIGALLNGGFYAISTWISGEEFSWRELRIQMEIGAFVGAIGAATFGASTGFLAARGINATANAVLSGAVSGTTTGFASGFAQSKTHGGSFSDALSAGGKSAVMGTIGGAVGGGALAHTGASLFGAMASGAVSGGVVGGIDGAWMSVQRGDSWQQAFSNIGSGVFQGVLVGGAIGAAGWGVGRASGMIKPLKGYPDHLPDPRNKGLLVKTNAYGSPDEIPTLAKPFKSMLSYRDTRYAGVVGKPGEAIHHIKPVSLGGTTTKGNLLPMPKELHSGQGNMHPGSFVKQQRYGTIFY